MAHLTIKTIKQYLLDINVKRWCPSTMKFQNCFGGSESFAFPCNSHIQNLEKNSEFFHKFLLTRILYLGEICYCFHTLDHQSNDIY